MTALNYADQLAIGGGQASAAYVGTTQVWGPQFRPTQLPGCAIWLDASKLGLANGAAVNVWQNLGSGSQPTITAGVTLRTNALNTNKPVVRFTQGAGKLRFATGTGVDKNWTLIYVGRKWSARAGRVVTAFCSSAFNPNNVGPNLLIGFHGNEYETAYIEGWLDTPGAGGGITSNTSWKMYSADAAASGPARLFSDGAYLGQFFSPKSGWNGSLCISGWTDDAAVATSQECDCEIAELVMYNRKLSDADRQQVESYLRTKWAPVAAFKPTDLAGCVIWQDASQLTGADGAAVTSWPNLGSGPAPAILGSPPPVIRANALNGKKVVKITGAQGRFRFTGTGVDKDYTVLFVARKWSTRIGRVVTANYQATSANILFGFWNVRFDCAYVEGWLTQDDVLTANLDWRWYTADATSAAPARLFKNGVLLRTGSATPAKGLSGTLNFSGHDDTSTEDADCEIAEVVLYNRQLSDAERAQVEQYLRLKWDPPTPAFKPSDLGPNLLGWFDAPDAGTVVTAGSGVSNWINKAEGAGLTLTQTNDLYRPAYTNGNGITFGNPQALVAANSPAAYDLVMFGKPRPAAGNDWRTLLRSSTGNTVDSHPIIIENGSARLGVYSAGFFPAGGLTWDSVYGFAAGRFSTAGPVMISRDGGPLTSTGATLSTVPFVSFGAYQGPPPSQGFGDILEIMFVTYNTPDNVRQMLEGYLAWKWGRTALLPADHPYKNIRP